MERQKTNADHILKKIILIIFVWTILRYAITAVGTVMLPGSNLYIPTVKFKNEYVNLISRIPIVAAWGNLDGANYIKVARTGYVKADLGFFPLYPLLMNVLFLLTGLSRIIIGQLISLACITTSFYLFYKLLAMEKHKINPVHFLMFVLVYPTAYYYGAAYNDSLFLLLATATLYLGRKKWYIAAAICSFFATLARLNGLALMFFLFFELYADVTKTEQITFKLPTKTQMIFLLKYVLLCLFPLFAFLSYLTYIHLTFGHWSMLFSSMKQWGQDQMIFPLQTAFRYIKIFLFTPNKGLSYGIAALEFAAVITYTLAAIVSWKKIRFSYWIFMVVSFIIPSLTGTFQGMPRYGLHLYPFFVAIWLWFSKQRKVTKVTLAVGSLVLQILLIILYTRGYFVS